MKVLQAAIVGSTPARLPSSAKKPKRAVHEANENGKFNARIAKKINNCSTAARRKLILPLPGRKLVALNESRSFVFFTPAFLRDKAKEFGF